MAKITTTTPELVKGERWYVDGKPGEVYSEPYATGYYTFHFDDDGFASNMNTADAHEWQHCTKTRVELQKERAQANLDKLGFGFKL
jgi:hypothetical protein